MEKGYQMDAASFRTRHGIEVNVDFCDEPKVSVEVKEAIYRTVQEVLNNIDTHAQATLVRIGLFHVDGVVRLEVNEQWNRIRSIRCSARTPRPTFNG